MSETPLSSRSQRGPAGSRPVPARAGGRLLERAALLERLLAARRLRCTVVCAPAGSGKTTLVAAWRRELVALGFDVAWLALGAEDGALAAFAQGLLTSLAAVDPALVRQVAPLGGADDAAERLAVALAQGLAAHPRDLVLVVDDADRLADPAALDLLQWLLDHAGAQLHIALVSRAPVPLSLGRLRSRSQTLELGWRELRFSLAETAQWLTAVHGAADARGAKALHAATDGWATGLQLLAGSAPPPAADGARPAAPRNAQALARYFEQQVLARLAADECALLVCVAPCNRFCAPLCAALADRPDGLVQALALLARLEAQNLFVVPVEQAGPAPWYRLHPLLREALQARFDAWAPERQRAVHGRAWRWFRDHGQLDEAVRHAVRAGEAAQAAELVERGAQALFLRGERRTLFALLRLLPAEQVAARPLLRIWMLRSQLFMREFEACARGIAALEQELPAADAVRRFQLAMLRATLCVHRDDSAGALRLLPQLAQMPDGVDPVARGGRNNILSWLHMHQGAFEEARRVQQDAPVLLVDGMPLVGTAGGSLQGRCLVGLSYAFEGQMTHAERIYRAVAAQAEQAGKACIDTYHLAIALLGDVLYELNEVQQACALLEDKVDVLERITIPDAVLRVLRLLSAAHWQAGHRLEAFAYLERLQAYAVRFGLDRLLAYSLADQAQHHLLLDETMAAQAVLARLDAVDARHAQAGQGALREIHEVAERARVGLAVAQGDFAGAAARLQALVARCEAHGHQRMAAHLLVRSAAVDARRGQPAASRLKLADALRRGHRLGLLRSLLDADPLARRMIGELLASGTLDPVQAFYAGRLQASQPGVPPQPAAAGARPGAGPGAEAFSEREAEVLRLLAQAMPNKKIARALGLSPETVKWYLSRLYAKLQVAGRDEAVARVRDMGWGLDG
ncbi:LuxR C-terminal-related transcriptional regulator [Pseudorhodoferax sp.]|uniref:LuxR C-terminal-related transcriptional regulator n=1 Tax=Pseudorhodoferax sp. TaxID=1993553 RepID=UPI002DD6A89D|nr:LuxR C-terminal-related transcriptional regulator [Pseudorhodoferax sp.]